MRKNQAQVAAQGSLSSAQASLSRSQGGLESLGLENAYLTHSLANYTTSSVKEVSQYFENSL